MMGRAFLVLVYTLMQGATNEPQIPRVMYKQKVLLRLILNERKNCRCQSLALDDSSLLGWAIVLEPMFQQSPYGFLSLAFRWDMSGNMSSQVTAGGYL